MNGIGTDVMALACILGGAGVGGAATLAVVEREPPSAMAEPCMVELVHAGPRVVMSLEQSSAGRATRVVVAPRPTQSWAHAHLRCTDRPPVSDAEIHMKGVLDRMERARVEMERARAEVARASALAERVRRVDRTRVEELGAELEKRAAEVERAEAELEGLEGALGHELESLTRQMEVQLERARRGGGS